VVKELLRVVGRYKLSIEYLGTNFHGWQVQPEEKTVQGEIQRALEVILKQVGMLQGSGRTDRGVHARGQVAHFDCEDEIDVFSLRASLNGILDKDVRVLDVVEVPPKFHARFDASYRLYRYYVSTEYFCIQNETRIHLKPRPNFELMNQASDLLIGKHDFGSFCRSATSTDNKVCTVESSKWVQESRSNFWHYEIVADRFLHGMVRSIVGTLLEIGNGKRELGNIEILLKANDRRLAGPAVKAKGLVLAEVGYNLLDD